LDFAVSIGLEGCAAPSWQRSQDASGMARKACEWHTSQRPSKTPCARESGPLDRVRLVPPIPKTRGTQASAAAPTRIQISRARRTARTAGRLR